VTRHESSKPPEEVIQQVSRFQEHITCILVCIFFRLSNGIGLGPMNLLTLCFSNALKNKIYWGNTLIYLLKVRVWGKCGVESLSDRVEIVNRMYEKIKLRVYLHLY
jgi:hypothetical protein